MQPTPVVNVDRQCTFLASPIGHRAPIYVMVKYKRVKGSVQVRVVSRVESASEHGLSSLGRSLLDAIRIITSKATISRMECGAGVWQALVEAMSKDQTIQEQFVQAVNECTELIFENDSNDRVRGATSHERLNDATTSFLWSLFSLPNITTLHLMPLHLPVSTTSDEDDLRLVPLQSLSRLRELYLGKGTVKTHSSLMLVAMQLPHLRSLRWDGWSFAEFKTFSQMYEKRVQSGASGLPASLIGLERLMLHDEPELTIAALGSFARFNCLTALDLIHTPNLINAKHPTHLLVQLSQACTRLRHLTLHLESWSETDMTLHHSPSQLISQLLSQRLVTLELGGGGLLVAHINALVQSSSAVFGNMSFGAAAAGGGGMMNDMGKESQLEHLRLNGVRLGMIDWSKLRSHGSSRPSGRATSFSLSSCPLTSLRSLRLIDCSDVECILPYLRFLPHMEDLSLQLTHMDEKEVGALIQQRNIDKHKKHPSSASSSSSPTVDQLFVPLSLPSSPSSSSYYSPTPSYFPSHFGSASTPSPSSISVGSAQPSRSIRALDLFTLALCPSLIRLDCDLNVHACVNESDDPRWVGWAALCELQRRWSHQWLNQEMLDIRWRGRMK